ncbi:hypothetical protein J3L16_15520 [Alteromonas sp. 5E99-2]|uniref:hypothetical protein n=1 Tax=Alteromonas sp. 5E99-2 TaxID=2817683 RepID=UPI001A99B662|nr:hypothetical protein [Alteromonas sp. 5E99-2]MBO1257093.1 hypothetical protein [Alteromonas sp. 5E99-2]
MNSHTGKLINELLEALTALNMQSEAQKIIEFKEQLDSDSQLERIAASKQFVQRCHVKWYGDLNLPIDRKSDYPVYVFLDELRKAVQTEVQ